MRNSGNITERIVKHSFIVVAMFAIAQYVFAVSGIRIKSEIETKHKGTHSSGVFSDLKSTVTFSLKDSYMLNSKNFGKTNFDLSSSAEQSNQQSAVSVLTFKKGNTTYILPYKPQNGLKLPGFIKMSPCENFTR